MCILVNNNYSATWRSSVTMTTEVGTNDTTTLVSYKLLWTQRTYETGVILHRFHSFRCHCHPSVSFNNKDI